MARAASSIRAAAGRNYISPLLSTYLVNRSGRALALENAQPSFSELTATERHILLLLSESKTSKEISSELGVSPRTIENHRANICLKIGCDVMKQAPPAQC